MGESEAVHAEIGLRGRLQILTCAKSRGNAAGHVTFLASQLPGPEGGGLEAQARYRQNEPVVSFSSAAREVPTLEFMHTCECL